MEKRSDYSVNEVKAKINQILSSDIKFEGHFNKCYNNLKETQQEELMEWIRDCSMKKINPVQSKTDKEIIGFVKRIGSNIRAILIRKKEKFFIKLLKISQDFL
jgi:hypothetical protein